MNCTGSPFQSECTGVWSEFDTDEEIRSRSGQPFQSDTVCSWRLSSLDISTSPYQDHHRALQACITGPPDNWRRRIGRPRKLWLRTVEADPRLINLGLATVKTVSGSIGLVETCGNGYVVSDTLLKKKKKVCGEQSNQGTRSTVAFWLPMSPVDVVSTVFVDITRLYCGCHRGYSISSVFSITVVYMGLRRATYKVPSFVSRTRLPSVVCALPRQVTSSRQLRVVWHMGDRAFAVAGPRVWNKLPDSVRQSSSLDVFKRLLKTHLFSLSFN